MTNLPMVETYHKRPNPLLIVFGVAIVAAAGYAAFRPSEETLAPARDETSAIAERTTLGGAIAYVEGGVEIRREGGAWTRAEAGDDLEEGDEIETFADGRAIIRLDDGSVLRLDGGTGVTLMSLDPSHIVVTNDGGKVYSRVVALERTFEVVSDGVTYESLGTAYATFNTADAKGVEVYESKVKVKDVHAKELAIVEEGKRFYLSHDADAGAEGKVTEIPADRVEKDAFLAWNKAEDGKTAAKDDGAVVAPRTGAITALHVGGGKVAWSTDAAFEQGFKIVWSKTAGPTFPQRHADMSAYVEDPSAREGVITGFDGAGTYHVRVCAYTGSGCDVYSNEFTATLEAKTVVKPTDERSHEEKKVVESPPEEKEAPYASSVTSISLSASGPKVSFTADGKAAQGFKVTYSRDAGPTYPTRPQDRAVYVGGGSSGGAYLEGFDGTGTYHVRVCEYTGDGCATYSDEISVELGGTTSVNVSSIVLAAAGGNKVTWKAVGSAPQGFKVVYGKAATPSFPPADGVRAEYHGDADASFALLNAFDGEGEYHVRVCAYTGDGCIGYSNELVVRLE